MKNTTLTTPVPRKYLRCRRSTRKTLRSFTAKNAARRSIPPRFRTTTMERGERPAAIRVRFHKPMTPHRTAAARIAALAGALFCVSIYSPKISRCTYLGSFFKTSLWDSAQSSRRISSGNSPSKRQAIQFRLSQ